MPTGVRRQRRLWVETWHQAQLPRAQSTWNKGVKVKGKQKVYTQWDSFSFLISKCMFLIPVICMLGFPDGASRKEPACNAGDIMRCRFWSMMKMHDWSNLICTHICMIYFTAQKWEKMQQNHVTFFLPHWTITLRCFKCRNKEQGKWETLNT